MGADGIKTGYLAVEKYSLASTMKKDQRRVIAVGSGFPTKNLRSSESLKLLNWGFKDTFREQNPDTSDKYSWFDYRSKGFVDNRGLRIDVVLATHALAERCIDTGIDYELRGIEKPSDHAPIWSTFK